MGLDYLRAHTGKPWRKRWDAGLDRLKAPSLLDLTFSEASRIVTVELLPEAIPRVGDKMIVQTGCDGLMVSDGLRPIGRVCQPSADLAAAIHEGGGYAEGLVQRVGSFGDTAEISVR